MAAVAWAGLAVLLLLLLLLLRLRRGPVLWWILCVYGHWETLLRSCFRLQATGEEKGRNRQSA